jgi:hypothetical protein
MFRALAESCYVMIAGQPPGWRCPVHRCDLHLRHIVGTKPARHMVIAAPVGAGGNANAAAFSL